MPRSGECLPPGCSLVLGHDVSGHAPAVLDVDPLLPGPAADCSRIDGAVGTAASSWPGGAADLAGVVDVCPQRSVEVAGVLSVQVDLIVNAGSPSSEPRCNRLGCSFRSLLGNSHRRERMFAVGCETFPAREVRRSSAKPSDNAARFRQPQRDVLGRSNALGLRELDLDRLRQTKPACMACRRSGVRIPLAPPVSRISVRMESANALVLRWFRIDGLGPRSALPHRRGLPAFGEKGGDSA
jgi:hypothetical protein